MPIISNMNPTAIKVLFNILDLFPFYRLNKLFELVVADVLILGVMSVLIRKNKWIQSI